MVRPSVERVADANEEAETIDPGTVIDGRYEIKAVLGAGGMGSVYEAEHLGLRRRVAVKILQTRRLLDESMQQRFEREAQTLAAVSHPNIVDITDFGSWNDVPYLVMEKLQGQNLFELLRDQVLSPREVADLMLQLLNALDHAHEQKLVHRDLKPGNVWIERNESGRMQVRLLDFGFAKFIDDRGDSLTEEGVILGTPAYMSPEQASGGSLDARTDIYSAGVLLFQMLTGCRPFEGEPALVLRAHIRETPPRVDSLVSGLHPAWGAVVARALEKRPGDRYQRASEFASAIVLLPREAVGDRVLRAPQKEVTSEAETRELDDADLEVTEVPPAEPAPEKRAADEPANDAPSDGAPSAPRRRAGLALVIGLGAMVALAVVLFVVGLPRAERRAAAPSTAAPAATPEPEPDLEPAEPEAEPVPEPAAQAEPTPEPPADPWNAWPADERLDALRAQLAEGRSFSASDKRAIRAMIGARPDDPRPHVLRARDHLTHRYFSSALDAYADLLRARPEAEAIPETLQDLVTLAASRDPEIATAATELLRERYGADAIATVDERMDSEAGAPAERLQALRDELASEPEG